MKLYKIITNQKAELFTWIALLVTFFATRIYNIKIIPIFTDEAIYSYWAQVSLHDPANRFISLEDGKQPLFIWMAAIFQSLFKDPLIAGRLASGSSGLLALIGIYFLANELFGKTVARISAILYIVLPFTLLYDRMGLFDSTLTMLGIWAIFLSIKVVRRLSLDFALLNGFSIGLALITKSSGIFFLYLLPFSLLLFSSKKNQLAIKFSKWIFFAALTIIISEVIYNALRLSPFFYIIARKNLEFIRPLSEVLKSPFTYFAPNSHAIVQWLIVYSGLPIFVLFLFGLGYGLFSRDKRIYYLAAVIFAPFFAEALFNKVLYPRFVLFYYPYIILVSAYAADKLYLKFKAQKKILILAFFIVMLWPIFNSFKLLTNPTRSQIPDADASQYLNSWPAGYGVEELTAFLKKESKSENVNIATEGTFGLFPFSLNIYFYQNDKVHVYSYWPVNPEDLPQQVLVLAKIYPTYFVFNENQSEINNPHLKFIQRYQKGVGKSYMRLYKVVI